MKKFEETLEGIIKKTFNDEIAFNRVKKGKIEKIVNLNRNFKIEKFRQIEISCICVAFAIRTENKSN